MLTREIERELWRDIALIVGIKEPKIFFVGVRVCGFAKKIVLHSVQSTSNAVEYFCFRTRIVVIFWQLKNKIVFGMVGTRSYCCCT